MTLFSMTVNDGYDNTIRETVKLNNGFDNDEILYHCNLYLWDGSFENGCSFHIMNTRFLCGKVEQYLPRNDLRQNLFMFGEKVFACIFSFGTSIFKK